MAGEAEIDALKRELDMAAKEFAGCIREIEHRAARHSVGDEDDITSQIFGAIQAVAPRLRGDLEWGQEAGDGRLNIEARHTLWRGRDAEESRSGTDALVVFESRLAIKRIRKGLLVQAKVVGSSGECSSAAERQRLVGQCDKMLQVTPASFVFSYRPSGFEIHSAASILASSGVFSKSLGTWPFHVFFRDFFTCWIGDRRIAHVSVPEFWRLAEALDARHGLEIVLSKAE